MSDPTDFRIHYADGKTVDVKAFTPDAAKKLAGRAVSVLKVKRIKEAAHAR